jgi:RNA-splicing ligase RtcB
MATSPVKRKSAMDTLLESMDELVDSAAERMTADELRKARKEINDVVDRAVVVHKRRRETA